MKGQGQKIPLVTDTRLSCTQKKIQKLNPASVCAAHLTQVEQGTHAGEG